jgi:hypothetical protein
MMSPSEDQIRALGCAVGEIENIRGELVYLQTSACIVLLKFHFGHLVEADCASNEEHEAHHDRLEDVSEGKVGQVYLYSGRARRVREMSLGGERSGVAGRRD